MLTYIMFVIFVFIFVVFLLAVTFNYKTSILTISKEFNLLQMQALVIAVIDINSVEDANDVFFFDEALFSDNMVVVVFVLATFELMIGLAVAIFELWLRPTSFQIAFFVDDVDELWACVKLHFHFLWWVSKFQLTQILHIIDVVQIEFGFFLRHPLFLFSNRLFDQIDLKELIWFERCSLVTEDLWSKFGLGSQMTFEMDGVS